MSEIVVVVLGVTLFVLSKLCDEQKKKKENQIHSNSLIMPHKPFDTLKNTPLTGNAGTSTDKTKSLQLAPKMFCEYISYLFYLCLPYAPN